MSNIKMFGLGEYVYLKHDPDQVRRMVIRIQESPDGFSYCVSAGMSEWWAYDMEMSRDVNVLAKIEANQQDDDHLS